MLALKYVLFALQAAAQDSSAGVLVEPCCNRGLAEPNLEQHSKRVTPQPLKKSKQTLLKIFVSSSMPKASLKALYADVLKIGGRLIFKGLIQNSFRETQKYFQELGISADIDPIQFEEYHITAVPTFVLGEHQLQGNITVEEALRHLKETRS